jgi:hypothetical protein
MATDSSIGIRAMTTPERVAITVHLKDGSAGSYEVKGQSQQKVLELLQPVATQLGVRISEEAAGAGVLPDSRLRFASRQLHHPPVRLRARRNPRTGHRRSAPIIAAPWPGVVVVHGFAGMSHDPRHQADWLAGLGYLAAAPDLYYWGSRCAACGRSCARPQPATGASSTTSTACGLAGAPGPVHRHDRRDRVCMGGAYAVALAPGHGYAAACVYYGGTPNRHWPTPARSRAARAARIERRWAAALHSGWKKRSPRPATTSPPLRTHAAASPTSSASTSRPNTGRYPGAASVDTHCRAASTPGSGQGTRSCGPHRGRGR